jgi:hypothetical protein
MKNRRLLSFCRFSIVFVTLLVCCGNITNSFLLKWGFRDDQRNADYIHTPSLVGVMEGAAPKPYVYRSAISALSTSSSSSNPSRDTTRCITPIFQACPTTTGHRWWRSVTT